MSKENQPIRKRRKLSFLPVVISISLVLFMLGLFGIILIQSRNLSTYIRENMIINVFLREDASQETINRVRNQMDSIGFAKEIVFISKEQAAQEFSAEVGQDFVSFLGFNPLMPSFQVRLREDYTFPEPLNEVEVSIRKMDGVNEVNFQRSLFQQAGQNIQTIGFILIGLALLFTVIAIILIANTVRLHLYTQRFIIKSMQLVGAKHWFIIKPFISKSVNNGFWAWMICVVLLSALLNILPDYINGVEELYDYAQFFLLYVVLLALGILISLIGSWFSTTKYLNTRIEDLY